MYRFLMLAHYALTVPVSVFFIMNSTAFHPSYRMNLWRKFALGFRMFFNTVRIRTGPSYKTHLAMALKILETSPDVPGDIVECGTWKGGSAANLSLVCRIAGRRLKIYDSFEGPPTGEAGDREAPYYRAGDYCGTLEEVKRSIGRHGALEACDFVPGWFQDTLPKETSPVLLAFLDVDLEASLHTCVRHLWPRRYWKTYFDRTPPGMIGAGTGLPLGEYYIGPWSEKNKHPLQHPNAGAYTRKDMSGYWAYYPEA
jgi:O-methyltransferase